MDKYLDQASNEKAGAKKLIDRLYKKNKGDQKKIHKDILDNVVNTKYGNYSNEFVTFMWDEFKAKFPS